MEITVQTAYTVTRRGEWTKNATEAPMLLDVTRRGAWVNVCVLEYSGQKKPVWSGGYNVVEKRWSYGNAIPSNRILKAALAVRETVAPARESRESRDEWDDELRMAANRERI